MTEELGRRILAELADIKARLPVSDLPPTANSSLGRKAAAKYLGMHEKTLAELTAGGSVAGYKSGSRWKYRLADLDRYRDELSSNGGSTRADRAPAIDWGA